MLSTAEVGRTSELLAMYALLSQGYTVLSPTVPTEVFDLAITKPGSNILRRIQVKKIVERTRDGRDYYVIRGLRSNGKPYTTDDCDFMLGVVGKRLFITPCRGISEYWVRKEDAPQKWTELII